MSTTVKRIALVLIVLLIVLAVFVGNFIARHKKEQPQMFADPVFDTQAPVITLPEKAFKVLVFSKTNGFRHHEAIPAANQLLQRFATESDWAVAFTENAAVFNRQQLSQFDVVVWNNVTGPALTNDQQLVFQQFVETGGGFVGIHAAGDGSHATWEWYANEVIRSHFTMHPMWPQLQTATLMTERVDHPAMKDMPRQWSMKDEWYSFEASVRGSGSKVLLTIDEASYDPNLWPMGEDHPLVWSHTLQQGRVVYSALGHRAEVYQNVHHQRLLLQAIRWVGQQD